MKTLTRILHTPPADLFLLAEAFLLLSASRIALKKIPLSRLVGWLRRPASKANPSQSEQTALRVQWAILAIVHRMPGSFVCFPQSLAAYAMLRRRGISGVLHYGVNRSPDNVLRAHTWLTAGELTVVGGESAPDFTVVSTFP
ncbi:MAG TPA: lasso peptide biosynthesis B2 protein [Acidisarcina sp.]|nr:lasso peptide biosynthesis B2 protein [Acidisarcina sp.]